MASLTEAEPLLRPVVRALPGYSEQKMMGADPEETDLDEFGQGLYSTLVSRVISLKGFTDTVTVRKLLICEGNSLTMLSECFHHLLENLNTAHFPSNKLDSIINILFNIVTSDALVTAIARISVQQYEPIVQNRMNSLFEHLCQNIGSLPERIANKTQGRYPDKFSLEKYGSALLTQTLKSLRLLINAGNYVQVDPKPIATFLGKLSTCFAAGKNYHNFIRLLDDIASENGEFVNEIFMNIHQTHTERFAIAVLQFSSCPERLLGSELLKNASWNYVFCKKLPFLSFSKDDVLISNLVKYLNHAQVLQSMVLDLVNVWGDKSALNHTPYDQHLYLTKILILAVHVLDQSWQNGANSTELVNAMSHAIPNHLESLVGNVRAIGMVTGEIVINSLKTPDSGTLLKFDFSSMNPEQAGLVEQLKNYDFVAPNDVRSCTEIMESVTLESEPPKITPAEKSENLDSDDDFEPYDLSNDVKTSVSKQCKYLRDLMEGLIESKDVDVFVESVKIAPTLIRKQLPKDDVSLALELIQLFVTLNENFRCEDFEQLRFEGLVETILVYPGPCVEYLCGQFHSPIGKYAISTRLLILESIRAAAIELSKVEKKNSLPIERVIRTNIIGKTRKIASHTVIKEATENKFGKVAGSFFYPLIRGKDQSFQILYQPTQSSHDDTSILLEALLKTLAVILVSSQNLGYESLKMSFELLEGIWLLRFHPTTSIIHAVIICIAAVGAAVPPNLIDKIFDDLIECREWLNSPVISNDQHLGPLAVQVSAFLNAKVVDCFSLENNRMLDF